VQAVSAVSSVLQNGVRAVPLNIPRQAARILPFAFVILNLRAVFLLQAALTPMLCVSFGELFAWIIGWALIMEYSIGIFM